MFSSITLNAQLLKQTDENILSKTFPKRTYEKFFIRTEYKNEIQQQQYEGDHRHSKRIKIGR